MSTVILTEGIKLPLRQLYAFSLMWQLYESPREMYGKTMSLPDDMMLRYFELVTAISLEELGAIESGLKTGELHPRDVKMRLARRIVPQYHDHAAAVAAEAQR